MAGTLFQWLITQSLILLHPFYVSMTEISHNTKDRTVEVSVRIFTDDFESALQRDCKCKVELTKPVNKAEMEKLVNSYINNHLKVKIDGQVKALEFAGFQREKESVWNYFQVKNVASVNKIEIKNSLLHEMHEEQINMLHIKANGKDKMDKLDYPNRNYTVVY
ncbi:MAG: hypothetical protein JWQ96_1968 [Segetibacter sp.]|nr:hypothetical protein [Segetibacter sp.]